MGRRKQIRLPFEELPKSIQLDIANYLSSKRINLDESTIEIVGYKPLVNNFKKLGQAAKTAGRWLHINGDGDINSECELAKILGVSRVTVRRWREAGIFGPRYINPKSKNGEYIRCFPLSEVIKSIENSICIQNSIIC